MYARPRTSFCFDSMLWRKNNNAGNFHQSKTAGLLLNWISPSFPPHFLLFYLHFSHGCKQLLTELRPNEIHQRSSQTLVSLWGLRSGVLNHAKADGSEQAGELIRIEKFRVKCFTKQFIFLITVTPWCTQIKADAQMSLVLQSKLN